MHSQSASSEVVHLVKSRVTQIEKNIELIKSHLQATFHFNPQEEPRNCTQAEEELTNAIDHEVHSPVLCTSPHSYEAHCMKQTSPQCLGHLGDRETIQSTCSDEELEDGLTVSQGSVRCQAEAEDQIESGEWPVNLKNIRSIYKCRHSNRMGTLTILRPIREEGGPLFDQDEDEHIMKVYQWSIQKSLAVKLVTGLPSTSRVEQRLLKKRWTDTNFKQ